jgi:MFS family permease
MLSAGRMRTIPLAYLSSYALSVLGNSIAAVALPLILLRTTESVLGAGALAAATAIPAVLAGLVMGALIDRINRRTASVVTDLISAAAVAALPLVDHVTGLTVGWFILFGVLGSLGDVPGLTAREALLPAVVRHGDIAAERLVGLRESLGAVAVVVGPAAAGGLLVALDGSAVLWVTAATSGGAALITLLIPQHIGTIEPSELEQPGRSAWRQLLAGWQVLFRSSPFLLVSTMVSVALVAVISAMQGLVLPVYFIGLDEPGLLGLVLSALALGSVVGGVSYAVGGTRGSRRGWFLTGMAGTVIGFTLMGLLLSAEVVMVGAAVIGLSMGWLGSLMGVVMLERIPESMRGRIMGTQNAILTAASPLGTVTAALFTHYVDVNTAGVVLAATWVLVALVAVLVPELRNLDPMDVGDQVGSRP